MKYAGAVTILACVIMSSCGPSPEEVAKAAVEEHASQIEIASTMVAGTAEFKRKLELAVEQTTTAKSTNTDTPTVTITSSPTYTQTLTVVPTSTATSLPTDTPVPTSTATILPTDITVSTATATSLPTDAPVPVPTATSSPVTPGGCPLGCEKRIAGCYIKGNISIDSSEKIYHLPGHLYYNETAIRPQYGERWFCTEAEAISNGWRRSMATYSGPYSRVGASCLDNYPIDCQGADLSGVNLQRRDLAYAIFTGANLNGANLRETNIGGTNFDGADLRNADLSWASFTLRSMVQACCAPNSNHTRVDPTFWGTKYNAATIWPNDMHSDLDTELETIFGEKIKIPIILFNGGAVFVND